ncbi:ras family-domain-containing protein [Crassisporium funariophilum]|nr:ras family-domain-containing protein [Crassisporium funariophilum]
MSPSSKAGGKLLEEYDISVMGDRSVGKTAFMIKAVWGSYTEGDRYCPTIDEATRVRIDVKDEESAVCELVRYNSVETCLVSEYHCIEYMHYTQLFRFCILVYDITSASSFAAIRFHHKFAMEMKAVQHKFTDPDGSWTPYFWLVGAKADLETQRQVPSFSGEALAVELDGCLGFSECSGLGNSAVAPADILSKFIHTLRLTHVPPTRQLKLHRPSFQKQSILWVKSRLHRNP